MTPRDLRLKLMCMQDSSVALMLCLTKNNQHIGEMLAALNNDDAVDLANSFASFTQSYTIVADCLESYCDAADALFGGDENDKG